MKDLVIFDLDGALAQSKASLDAEMAGLLGRLLAIVNAAIISGGAWTQFEKQALAFLPLDDRLKNLSPLPTRGMQFYRFNGARGKRHALHRRAWRGLAGDPELEMGANPNSNINQERQ